MKLSAGFDGDYNSLTDKPELFSGDYNDLDNLPQIPADVSAFNNDAGYITQMQLDMLLGSLNALIDSLNNEVYELKMKTDTTLYTVTVAVANVFDSVTNVGSVMGGGSFRWGTLDTLVAVPDSGYMLRYWVSNLGDTVQYTDTLVVTVKQDVV